MHRPACRHSASTKSISSQIDIRHRVKNNSHTTKTMLALLFVHMYKKSTPCDVSISHCVAVMVSDSLPPPSSIWSMILYIVLPHACSRYNPGDVGLIDNRICSTVLHLEAIDSTTPRSSDLSCIVLIG
jgi:hypothetical protein